MRSFVKIQVECVSERGHLSHARAGVSRRLVCQVCGNSPHQIAERSDDGGVVGARPKALFEIERELRRLLYVGLPVEFEVVQMPVD